MCRVDCCVLSSTRLLLDVILHLGVGVSAVPAPTSTSIVLYKYRGTNIGFADCTSAYYGRSITRARFTAQLSDGYCIVLYLFTYLLFCAIGSNTISEPGWLNMYLSVGYYFSLWEISAWLSFALLRGLSRSISYSHTFIFHVSYWFSF